MSTINLAILASGNGTNAENIVNYFSNYPEIEVKLIGSNKETAFVLSRAKSLGIPTTIFSDQELADGTLSGILKQYEIDYIILAGFLLKVSKELILEYQDKIINIHPALLPAYGGKGMYGNFVHKAVLQNKEPVSGISIHLVDENYDEGKILFQAMTEITEGETADTLAGKVHKLEHFYFPGVIKDYILNRVESEGERS